MEIKEAIEICERIYRDSALDATEETALGVLIDLTEKPQDAILFCPECKEQHVDKAEPNICESCGHPKSEHFGLTDDDPDDVGCYACGGIVPHGCKWFVAWLNPPHKKHRCHNCNHVWKAAMIPTNGVESLQATTEGKDGG